PRLSGGGGAAGTGGAPLQGDQRDRGRADRHRDVAARASARPAAAAAARAAQEDEIMNCTRLRQVLDGWLDGELDRTTGTEIEQHLESCASCTALKTERDALRARLRAELPYFRAPAGLEGAVRRSLAATGATLARSPRRPGWPQAAVVAFVAACTGALGGYWVAQRSPANPLPEQV